MSKVLAYLPGKRLVHDLDPKQRNAVLERRLQELETITNSGNISYLEQQWWKNKHR